MASHPADTSETTMARAASDGVMVCKGAEFLMSAM